MASLSGLPPQADAEPSRWRIGSTVSRVPKAFLKSGMVEDSTSRASRTFFWLAASHCGNSSEPGAFWLTLIASCSVCTCLTSSGLAGSTKVRMAVTA
ncbi:hypothetical protein D3C76_1525780 [compost metagenome]